MSGEFIVLGVPFAAFSVTAAVAYGLAKSRVKPALVALGVVWAAFTASMFFGMEQASGWDGLGYLFALLGLSAPSGAGLLIGGLVGWLRNEKVDYA